MRLLFFVCKHNVYVARVNDLKLAEVHIKLWIHRQKLGMPPSSPSAPACDLGKRLL